MMVSSNIDRTDLHVLYNKAMSERVSGYVMLVGNGAVGKTTVSKVLSLTNRGDKPSQEILSGIRKTNNLEYEFITTDQQIGDKEYSVTLQFLIPPGQKRADGDPTGRSFEDVIDIFRPTIHRLDVVLFTYDMTSMDSFHDLVYWIDGVGDLLNDASHFILLGTHLDRESELEITRGEIEKGLEYLAGEMRSMRPSWKGNFARLEVSNLTGENLDALLYYLAGSVISSRNMIP
jgi:GTPase SAR1 family protein